MKQRLLYLTATYLTTVVIFIIAKGCFVIYNMKSGGAGLCDFADVVRHGLSLDLSTAIYILIVPFLISVISLWTDRWRLLRKILNVYYAVVASLLAIVFVSDTCLYEFWGFKLNGSVIPYLETPAGITSSVSWWYLAARVLFVIAAGYIIYKVYSACIPRNISRLSLRMKILNTLLFVVAVFPLVVGIRGGLEVSTTNVGQVYYSDNQFLNHSAVNPLFNFLSSFGHSAKDYDRYEYFDYEECERMLSGMFPTESMDIDTLLNTARPNVVVILLEGCGGEFTEIGGRDDVMPNLNRIAREGVYFTNCYGNSWRTDRGVVCALSGYPSFPQASVMKMPDKSGTMPSIASSLKKNGYSTSFLYGGDINFTNMRGYLIGTGFDNLVSMDDYSEEQRGSGKWGVRDDITFGTLYDMITGHGEGRFLIGYLTLTSHEPWEVPVNKFEDKVLNSFYYLDMCIGSFMDRLRKTPQWDELLVVLLPDHGIYYDGLDNSKPLRNHIPMIWTGGAVRRPHEVTCLSNQTDLPATLLGQMNISHDEFTFSRDVVSGNYRYPFAVNTFDNGMMVMDSTGYVVYDFDMNGLLSEQGKDSRRLLDIGKAILQVTSADLKNRK
ncbi:LTA synthase family protein [Xylanibacter muris]|uniref:Sulfatase-like hydrolase/transferase n=1 Tax=Xylanibacter muris TaxID=2736290 RepID=A0ABX2AJH7_9BACT|nr:LTA synthase family protein [Xylanibacter muris]NPD90943.1 sulfatase-like hydrolase/transferase [Xylanibacter muris]